MEVDRFQKSGTCLPEYGGVREFIRPRAGLFRELLGLRPWEGHSQLS